MTATSTLAGRIARAMALAAALSAAGTAVLSEQLAWRWTLSREDARLLAAARVLVSELPPSLSAPLAEAEADDEDHELSPAGVRIALWQGRTWRGGARGLSPGPAGCDDHPGQGGLWRRCTVPVAQGAVVAASSLQPLQRARGVGWGASLAAVCLAVLVAAWGARRVALRVVGPLARLRALLPSVRPEAPDAGVLGADEGVEEVDALRAALAALLERQAEAMTRAQRFAADAAHELRTPLTTMQAELELAAERSDMTAEGAAALGRVQARLTQVTTLCARLLILASPLTEGVFGREAVSLAEVCADAVAALGAEARARVVVDAEDEGLLRGDTILLRVLVDNVLDNALKFAREGVVRVSVSRVEGAVVLRVRDQGPGLTAAEAVRVFEAFHRTAGARAGEARGHGVGLALVAHIARAHGATVGFEAVTAGASLRVSLPGWDATAVG